MEVLVDCPLVAGLKGTKVLVDCRRERNVLSRLWCMGRSCADEELCRILSALRLELHLLCSHWKIDAIPVVHYILHSISNDLSLATDIDGTKLSSLKKIVDTEVLPGIDILLYVQSLLYRHCSHCDDSVHVGVDCADIISIKDGRDEEL